MCVAVSSCLVFLPCFSDCSSHHRSVLHRHFHGQIAVMYFSNAMHSLKKYDLNGTRFLRREAPASVHKNVPIWIRTGLLFIARHNAVRPRDGTTVVEQAVKFCQALKQTVVTFADGRTRTTFPLRRLRSHHGDAAYLLLSEAAAERIQSAVYQRFVFSKRVGLASESFSLCFADIQP